MEGDKLLLGQRERDRLKTLHEISRGSITQRIAATQLKLSERQVRRLMNRFEKEGDSAVVHVLRGRCSNRKISEEVKSRAIAELSKPELRDFGPTYAAEHLNKQLGIAAGKDTVRKWMVGAGLWESRERKAVAVHQWRERRACFGELLQWDTSVHDWLEGRGEKLYLIAMIDDATSRLFARFAPNDTTDENMRVLWCYVERYGRPQAVYTDRASLFQATMPSGRTEDQPGERRETQMGRALREFGIEWIAAHSPQAKGRIERCFATAQDRLVKGMRLAGIRTREQANAYLAAEYLPDWNQRFTTEPANATDAHRPLTELHDLAASFSHVELRTVSGDYTFPFRGERYQIARESVRVGMRRQKLRVEARLDGTVAARYEGEYLQVAACGPKPEQAAAKQSAQPITIGAEKATGCAIFTYAITCPDCVDPGDIRGSYSQKGPPGKSSPAGRRV